MTECIDGLMTSQCNEFFIFFYCILILNVVATVEKARSDIQVKCTAAEKAS